MSVRHSGRLFFAAAVAVAGAVSVGTLGIAQPTAEEQIQALERRSFELLGNPNKHEEAQSLAQQALEIAERSAGRESAAVAQRLDNLAFTIRIQHRYAEAAPHLDRALSIREKLFGIESPDLCQSLTNLAVLYELKKEFAEAQRLLTRCLTLRERAFGTDHPTVGHTLHMLAKLYRQSGRGVEAGELRSRAVDILGTEHPALIIDAYQSGARGRDRTFFDQISDYHWTGIRIDPGDTDQRLILLGEATFNNGLWNPFAVEFAQIDGIWKATRIHSLPMYWKVPSP